MKKLYYLTLMGLVALFITSCADVKGTCNSNSDCTDEGYKCYAGYCSDLIAQGNQYFDVKLLKENSDMELTCEEAKIKKVGIEIYRAEDNYLLPKEDENPYEGINNSYQYELPCEDVLTNELAKKFTEDEKKYFYVGSYTNHKNGRGPLQWNKDYKIRFIFLNESDISTTFKDVVINADIGFKAENIENVNVEIDTNAL